MSAKGSSVTASSKSKKDRSKSRRDLSARGLNVFVSSRSRSVNARRNYYVKSKSVNARRLLGSNRLNRSVFVKSKNVKKSLASKLRLKSCNANRNSKDRSASDWSKNVYSKSRRNRSNADSRKSKSVRSKPEGKRCKRCSLSVLSKAVSWTASASVRSKTRNDVNVNLLSRNCSQSLSRSHKRLKTLYL